MSDSGLGACGFGDGSDFQDVAEYGHEVVEIAAETPSDPCSIAVHDGVPVFVDATQRTTTDWTPGPDAPITMCGFHNTFNLRDRIVIPTV